MKLRFITIGLGVGALVFAILSARLGIPYLAFGVVACAIASAVLCVWGRLESKTMPYLVFLLGLAFLYQATLISNGLVGTDIHTEYYFYLQALDGWDITIPHSYNTAIGTTVIAPFLTNAFGIPGYWIYKAIYPFMFAFVPLILSIIYRKEFGEKVALLGCLFFITLPTYTLEMIGLPRQMLGELMLAVVLLLVIVRPIRLRYSIPLLCVAATMGYLFHYITGPAILMYLVGGSLVLLFMKRRQFAVRWLLVVIVVSGVIGFGYYSQVSDGVVLANLGMTGKYAVEKVVNDDTYIPPVDVLPPRNPTSLYWVEKWIQDDDWDERGHSQDVACDGIYIWWSGGDKVSRTYMSSPDWDNPFAENDHAMTDGMDMEQINGIELQGDYIYATGTKFLATPYRCFVKWYDKLTLEFVGEQELTWDGGGSTQEGIVYGGGYWWVCFFDRAVVAQYDTSFNYLGCVDLPGQSVEIQGCEWFNDQLWVISAAKVRVYDWDGNDFTLAVQLSIPAQILHPQSIGICPEGASLYWGDFTEVEGAEEVIHKCSIIWEDGAPVDIPPQGVSFPSRVLKYFSSQELLIRTALGLDFMTASVSGKAFRIFQFLTQISLILGCVWFIRNRKKVSAEFVAFTITAIALIVACVILPRFSNIINVTRFYHLALFLVSPLLVMGGLYIFRNLKLFVALLLIPYMLFTTGVIFEAAQEKDIAVVNLPYSIALSNERVGMIGTYTESDLIVRDWAVQQDYSILLTDINGMLIISEIEDPFTYLYTPKHEFENHPIENDGNRWGYIPYPMSRLPSGNYTYLVYLTEWNTQNEMLIFKPTWYDQKDTASGMRQSYPFEFVGLPDGFIEVYRQGDAVLLKGGYEWFTI